MKKKTVALLIAIGLCVCIAAAAICFFLLRPQTTVLYYNLDGSIYQNPSNTALSNRRPDAEGVYRISFAAAGETVTCTTTDAKLVDIIDCLQVMTLEVSAGGKIQNVGAPAKPLSNQDTVQQIREKELVLNTSIAYNGGQLVLPLADNCRFYDLSNGGADTQPEIMDEILAYGNARGEATDVFILRRTPYTELYWRLDQKYDLKAGLTTRQHEGGIYTIPFAVNGEHVELKCKDMDIVTQIDAPGANKAAMGLELDSDGYIVRMLPAFRALRGRELCSLYDVTGIDGDRFSVVNKQLSTVQGQSFYLTKDADCKIYDVSSAAALTGQLTDSLQLGDRITVYSDPMGIATRIFVHVRLQDSPVYFNLFQMYQEPYTTRRPDADGWYTYRMVSNGQQLELKTNDISIANKIDSYSTRGMGLKLNGDVIEQVFDVSCATGGSTLVAGRYVHSFTAGMIATANNRGTGLKPTLLHVDCKIYDATGGPDTGKETTLRKGDQFYAYGDADDLATHIFITKRGTW